MGFTEEWSTGHNREMARKTRDAAPDDSRRQKALRTRLLNDEVDRLRDDSTERARSVDSKSTFLAVASGIVITASTSHAWSSDWILGSLPLGLSSLALIAATFALLPGRRQDLTPRVLHERWDDTERNIADVEAAILRLKVSASSAREENIRRRAMIASLGFALLAASSVALVVVFSIDSTLKGAN